MDWVRELCDLYEKNANLAGQYEKGRFGEPLILLPVFHSTVASQITVTINEKGEFLRAVTVEDEEKLTEEDLRAIIDKYTEGRVLWIFGEKRVNVLLVNLALDGLL